MSSEGKQLTNKRGKNETKNRLDDSKELIELFNKLDEDQREEVIIQIQKHSQLHSISQVWQGPLPPPSALKGYEEVLPGAANRIIKMAERQVAHRQKLEKEQLEKVYQVQSRGQHYALIIVGGVTFGGMFLISYGFEISGLLVYGTTLIGLAYVFITGRKPKLKKDLSEDKFE